MPVCRLSGQAVWLSGNPHPLSDVGRACGISYRVPRPAPLETSAPMSRSAARSRVAVVAGHLVIARYFFADIPPLNPARPSLNMRSIALVWRSFMTSRWRSQLRRVSTILTSTV